MTTPENTKETSPFATTTFLGRLKARILSLGTFDPPPSRKNRTSDDLAQDRTTLAAARTLMAADRSLMAWVRTALSMISFGFTIYKVLQGFQESGAALTKGTEPRTVGLFLIGLGSVSMVMGAMEYWHRARELSVHGHIAIWRPSFVMAMLIAVLSVFLFFAVIFKVL